MVVQHVLANQHQFVQMEQNQRPVNHPHVPTCQVVVLEQRNVFQTFVQIVNHIISTQQGLRFVSIVNHHLVLLHVGHFKQIRTQVVRSVTVNPHVQR